MWKKPKTHHRRQNSTTAGTTTANRVHPILTHNVKGHVHKTRLMRPNQHLHSLRFRYPTWIQIPVSIITDRLLRSTIHANTHINRRITILPRSSATTIQKRKHMSPVKILLRLFQIENMMFCLNPNIHRNRLSNLPVALTFTTLAQLLLSPIILEPKTLPTMRQKLTLSTYS
jgi:hypothetical protein